MAFKSEITNRIKRLPMISWIMLLLVLLSLSAGTVVGYLFMSTAGGVTNTLKQAPQVDPQVKEDAFEDNVSILKENVCVSVGDTGYDVYVRAAIVVTWKNGSSVLPVAPVEGVDYSLEEPDPTLWFKNEADGFYYYLNPVVSGHTTEPLIGRCTVLKEAPTKLEGYTLSVDILTQTIQKLGTTDKDNESAVKDAWGIDFTKQGE